MSFGDKHRLSPDITGFVLVDPGDLLSRLQHRSPASMRARIPKRPT